MSAYSHTLIGMISKLNLEDKLLEVLNGNDERFPLDNRLDKYSKRLISMSKQHLEFVIKYGKEVDEVTDEGGRIRINYSEFFYAWQVAGCPGISSSTLQYILLRDLKGSPAAKEEPFSTWMKFVGK